MKTISIQGETRQSVGKTATKALRKAGSVPCVIYGDEQLIHFATQTRSFKDLIYTPDAHFVRIELQDGTAHDAILQDVQFHPVTEAILHADFYLMRDDKAVSMLIPVHLKGRSRGVTAGGSLNLYMRRLKVHALPAQLPEAIEIDITSMRIGDKKYVTELQGGDQYKLLHPDNAVIVAVRRSRAAMSANTGGEEEEQEEQTPEAENA